jgi:hypothetical protein
LPNIIGLTSVGIRWTGRTEKTYRVLLRKPERKTLGIPRHRWRDNIKLYVREIGWGGMDCIELAQDLDQQSLSKW